MFAALCVALSLTAPATLTSTALPTAPILETQGAAIAPIQKQLLEIDPNSPDREPSFVDRYLSFQLSPMASQQAKDGLVLSHVVGYLLPCGSLWGPVVFVDGAEFNGDVFITWFLSSIVWAVIMGVASTVTVGIGLVLFIAFPYLSTTATLNEVDRDLKKRGLAGSPPDKNPGPQPATPPSGTETPPPSYAY